MFTFIDLFSGCGGLTLGLMRAGLRPIAAIDDDRHAISVFRENLPEVPHVLQRDLTTFDPKALEKIIGTVGIDAIVGGPPCQGFSTARQRDGANHGKNRLVSDERRDLYLEFLRFVAFFRPRLFLIENVPGIRSAAGGLYFTRLQREGRNLGYRVHNQTEDAWELGLPQKRRRELIIGVRTDIREYFRPVLPVSSRATPRMTLDAAIGDLPVLSAGCGDHEMPYDLHRRARHFGANTPEAGRYLVDVLEVEKSHILRNHVSRPHSDRDLRDFARLREGENASTAMRSRQESFEFPYDRMSFKDRFTRQHREAPCSTIVAHLAKDGLMFIHPTQNRSLTPREAARIQSFPDWFEFPEARTHAFRLIGNAVPPLVAESIGIALREFLRMSDRSHSSVEGGQLRLFVGNGGFFGSSIDIRERRAAGEAILPMLGWTGLELGNLDNGRLLSAWQAALYLFPLLHPSGVLDHGTEIDCAPFSLDEIEEWEEVFAPRFARSGWPVVLTAVGKEVHRRFVAGKISDKEFYGAHLPPARRPARHLRRRTPKRETTSRQSS